MKRHVIFATALTCMGLVIALPSQGRAAPNKRPSLALQRLDTDHDGTVDSAEADKAAMQAFARLDRDHDGTLDRRELRGRLSRGQYAAADTDHDGTISQNEYTALVERRFRAADRDHDGTLDQRELHASAGRKLLTLIQ